MQDDTALYGAKMMQPGMTAADSEELERIEKLAEGPEYRLSFALVEWLERLLSAGKETAIS